MYVEAKLDKGLASRWNTLASKKTTILKHCEQYAAWTLPYVFPPENTTKDEELPVEVDSIGSQGVNHLANKIVSTLYPAKQLFFRLAIDQKIRDTIEAGLALASAQAGQQNDPQTIKSQLETQIQAAEELLLKAEKRAEEHLDMVKYRPQAINAVKLLIITGNAMVFHPEDGGSVQVYNLRNFHVCRDCNNEMVEFMTREKKAFETFSKAVQDQLTADATFKAMHKTGGSSVKGYNDETEVTIYTQGRLHDDGKWHIVQYADEIRLDTARTYTTKELRWIPLTWNLIQGEDYGRGLVADFAGAFHSLMILNNSLLNIAAIAGDIKIYVKPNSLIDVVQVQNSPPGSYHSGNPEDVGTGQFQHMQQVQFLQDMIARYEKQIAQAFMLTQQLRRDAERVTAEEIRQDVDELETSNSGVYSRLAADWQTQTAFIALEDTDFDGIGNGVEPRVITGMDSLSRSGEAYNMRLFLADVGLLNSVPEDIRMSIKKPAYLKQVAQYHQVPYESWIMTDAELQQAQNAQMEQQMALQQQQTQGQAGVEIAKAAASSE